MSISISYSRKYSLNHFPSTQRFEGVENHSLGLVPLYKDFDGQMIASIIESKINKTFIILIMFLCIYILKR